MSYDNFSIPEIVFGIKRYKGKIDYAGVRQGPTWILTPDPKDRTLRIQIDPPPDGNFHFDDPHYKDNEMVFTLDDLKDVIKKIETGESMPEHKFTFKPSHSCGWVATPGSSIACDSVNVGPWYCPKCGQELEVRLEKEG